MRINQQAVAKTTQQNSYFAESYFNVIFEAEIKNNQYIKIPSNHAPNAILWKYSDGSAYYDEEPKHDATITDTSGPGLCYKSPNGKKPSAAYFIPSDTLLASRIIDELNIPVQGTDTTSLFNYLNLKLENINNNVSIWDFLNIYKVVYTKDELSDAVASLPINSSVIVNVDDFSLYVGQWNVIKGDMIIKDKDGVLHHLKGASGGFYYPAKIQGLGTGSGMFSINFKYSQEEPEAGTSTTISNSSSVLSEPKETIILKVPNSDNTTNTTCYSEHIVLNSGGYTEVTYQKLDSNNIEPVVYYYLNGERIYFPKDYEVSQADANKFICTNQSNFTISCEVR